MALKKPENQSPALGTPVGPEPCSHSEAGERCDQPGTITVGRRKVCRAHIHGSSSNLFALSREENQVRVRAILADLKERKGPSRDWAHKLKARHEAGEQLTPAQIALYQDALKSPVFDRVPGEDDEEVAA